MARAAGFQNQFMLALTKAVVARGRRAGELYDLSNEDSTAWRTRPSTA